MFEHQAQHMLGMVDCPVAPRWQCNWMVNLWICTFCYWWYRPKPNRVPLSSQPFASNLSISPVDFVTTKHSLTHQFRWIWWKNDKCEPQDGERKKNIFCLALAIHINGMLLIICNSRDSIVTIAMLSSYSFDGILRVTLTQYVAHTLIIIMMMTMVVVVVVVYACICQLAFSASECVSARMNKGSRCTDAS